jgi:hypothetical protein
MSEAIITRHIKQFETVLLSILLAVALPFVAHAETRSEIKARAEKMLLEIPQQIPRGPDLPCQTPQTFKYYKMQFDGQESSPELCNLVDAYSSHFTNSILPFWSMKENFGIVVGPISKIEQYNAAFISRPIINKNSIPNLLLLYLPGISISAQKPVWSHEAGHAALQEIFDDYFYQQARENFIQTVENVTLRTAGEERLNGLLNQLEELHQNFPKMTDKEKNKSAQLEAALNFRIQSLQNKIRPIEVPTSSPIAIAFHEFFADLFAANLHNDLNIVGDSFDQLGIKSTISDHRRFNPGVMSAVKGWAHLEPHILLTPARHYFGKFLASRVNDKKAFLHELAKYFIRVLQNPSEQDSLSYKPLIAEVESSQTPEALTSAMDSRLRSMELVSKIQSRDIKNFCEMDFHACKVEILEQLKRGQRGLLLTNANPEIANQHLIEAMEAIVKDMK